MALIERGSGLMDHLSHETRLFLENRREANEQREKGDSMPGGSLHHTLSGKEMAHLTSVELLSALLQKRDAIIPALTLTQPFATLVAGGAKHLETRSWSTSYRGPLAIHAAKGFPADAEALCEVSPFREALLALGYSRGE